MEHRLACGVKRCRMRRRIQECLDRLGMTQKDVAKSIGVHPSLVAGTIGGDKHSPKVLGKLRELGVPERYLHDPNHEEAA